VPFNFQIAKTSRPSNSRRAYARGELEVRLIPVKVPITVLPLAPAATTTRDGAAGGALSSSRGPHDLCFTFTQRTLDPMWPIDWVQLAP